MRYLGSKESLSQNIKDFLVDKHLTGRNMVFFDAFCGMGSVSYTLKSDFDIVINDLLKSCTVYSQARLLSNSVTFANLDFDPIEYLNQNANIKKGFVYNNYSLGGSDRMYFTETNAGKIDFFRETIENWYQSSLINKEQYIYLLGCLLESVSQVSNTAGVYGAFLKHWDGRALKEIKLNHFPKDGTELQDHIVFNNKIEDIIADIDCDILYLDPPYTQNQYGTQYHLLETLILQDNPPLSKITGSRPTAPIRSNWSKDIYCHILLDEILAKTKARYILLSYNNDGFMSKDYLESIFKRYGHEDTFQCITFEYKKYNNFKCQGKDGHFEYLFFIEKKKTSEISYESPLNYQGNKNRMINDIIRLLPQNTDTFIDAFGGGFNVGINIPVQRIIYNDINHFVKDLIASFHNFDTYKYVRFIQKTISTYDLSTKNKEAYLRLREEYNNTPIEKRDPKILYTIILFGFQQQIRFNSSYGFNNPFGTRYFNDRILAKFISFSRKAKEGDIVYENVDYKELEKYVSPNCVFYFDPPYLNAIGAYNDGKRGFEGWSLQQETVLLQYLDRLTALGIRFILSYIPNTQVTDWAQKAHHYIIPLAPQGRYNNRQEILICNYAI